MEELSPEIGVGIFASLIGAFTLMLKWATERFGKPATNQALDLASQSMSLFTELKDAINELKDAATSMKQEIVSARSESSVEHKALMDVITTFHNSNSSEHKVALAAIHAIPAQIEPHYTLNTKKIESLEDAIIQKQKTSEGLTSVMVKAVESQGKTNGEMLAALKRVQESQIRIEQVFTMLLESNRRNEKLMMELLEKPQQDLKVLEEDAKKTVEAPAVAPANQPVLMPKPESVDVKVDKYTLGDTPTTLQGGNYPPKTEPKKDESA